MKRRKLTRLIRVEARNYRGQTFDYSINESPLLFHGQNGAGKTTRLDAIRFGLLGPRPGETVPQIKSSSDKHEVLVRLTLDDGTVAERSIRHTSPNHVCLVNGEVENSENSLASRLGIRDEVLSPMRLMEMSHKDLKTTLFGILGVGDMAREDALKTLCEIMDHEMKGDRVSEVVESSMRCWVGSSIIDKMDNILNAKSNGIKDQYTYFNRRQKELSGAFETLCKYGSEKELETFYAGSLDDIKARQSKIERELESLRGKRVVIQNRVRMRDKVMEKVQKMTAMRDAAKIDADPEILRSKTVGLEELIQRKNPNGSVEKRLNELASEIGILTGERNALLREADSMKAHGGRCPVLGDLCHTLEGDLFESYRERKNVEFRELQRNINELNIEKDEFTQIMSEVGIHEKELHSVKLSLGHVEDELRKLNAANDMLSQCEEELEGLGVSMDEAEQTMAEVEKLNEDIVRLHKDLDAIKDHRDEKMREMEIERAKIRTRADAQTAVDCFDLVKKLKDAHTTLLSRVIENCSEHFEISVQKAVHCLFGEDAEFVMTMESGMELGVQIEGRFIRWDWMSRAERTLFGAALTYGLMMSLDMSMKVFIMDDMDSLDAKRFERVREFIRRYGKDLGGVVLASVREDQNEEWEVVKL